LNPDALPDGDVTKMDFGSGGASDAKAWRDIWGCGQGIGGIKKVEGAAQVVKRLREEYAAAVAEMDAVVAQSVAGHASKL
jgi:nitronate monooxygenase